MNTKLRELFDKSNGLLDTTLSDRIKAIDPNLHLEAQLAMLSTKTRTTRDKVNYQVKSGVVDEVSAGFSPLEAVTRLFDELYSHYRDSPSNLDMPTVIKRRFDTVVTVSNPLTAEAELEFYFADIITAWEANHKTNQQQSPALRRANMLADI